MGEAASAGGAAVSIADHLGRLPPKMQRVLALAVLPTIVVAALASAAWPAWHAYRAQADWRLDSTLTLARQRGIAEIEPLVRAQLEALPKLKMWRRFYRLNTDGSAVAAIQSDLSRALSASRARPQAFEPLALAAIGPLHPVGIRVSVSLTIDQLRDFLQQTGRLEHFVRIAKLSINAPAVQAAQDNPPLMVVMDVVGFAVEGPR